MRYFLFSFILALLFTLKATIGYADQQKNTLITDYHAQKFKNERFEKNIFKNHRTKHIDMQNMTTEERKIYMQEQRLNWNSLSMTEKQEKRKKMLERWSKLPPEVRERRREKFLKMSAERQQAFKERHPTIYQDIISKQ